MAEIHSDGMTFPALTDSARLHYTVSTMAQESALPNATCPQCGQPFHCGAASGEATCPCFDLPHVIPLGSIGDTAIGCLCLTCLRRLIEEKQSESAG